MKLPSFNRSCRRTLPGVYLALGAIAAHGQAPAQLQEELAENWYRTEVLIFVRERGEIGERADSPQAEQWDPLPALQYPEHYRYLLDPTLADQRLEESLAYASSIDTKGTQTLTLPAPIRELLDHDRPDALTVPMDTQASASPDSIDDADNDDADKKTDAGQAQAPTQDGEDNLAGEALMEADVTSPILSLPYELLGNESLEFRRQARSLRRQGHRVVFHKSWWATLDEAADTPALIIDRSGDMDRRDWPALQGSLQVYRSRYLHIVLDLWLNTLGEYLPEGWQIESPPLPQPSLKATTLSAQDINPWAPSEIVDDSDRQDLAPIKPLATPYEDDASPDYIFNAGADAQSVAASYGDLPLDADQAMSKEQARSTPPYPWRHAIVHKQTRRMRSNEIHYLDHPVIGVIVKVTPMSDEALPLVAPERRAFRERHALPIDMVSVTPKSDEP